MKNRKVVCLETYYRDFVIDFINEYFVSRDIYDFDLMTIFEQNIFNYKGHSFDINYIIENLNQFKGNHISKINYLKFECHKMKEVAEFMSKFE